MNVKDLESLKTIGVLAFAALLAWFGAAAIQADANAVVGAVASLLGGVIGVGGSALAVFLMLNAQRRETRNNTLTVLYPEIKKYLTQTLSRFVVLISAMEKENTLGFLLDEKALNDLLDLTEPDIFPKVRLEVNRLDCRALVVKFYGAINGMREAVTRDPMKEIEHAGEVRKLMVVLKTSNTLRAGLEVLISPEFSNVGDNTATILIEGIKRALASSPIRAYTDPGLYTAIIGSGMTGNP